jgi:hypothetical protein
MPKKHEAEARPLLCAMPYAETQADCEALRAEFTARYRKLVPKAVERLADDWERSSVSKMEKVFFVSVG